MGREVIFSIEIKKKYIEANELVDTSFSFEMSLKLTSSVSAAISSRSRRRPRSSGTLLNG